MLPTFLCSVAGGMLAALGASRVDVIAHAFVRLIGIVVLAASAPTALWSLLHADPQGGARWTVASAATLLCALSATGIILMAPWIVTRSGIVRTVAAAGGFCGVGATCLWAWTFAAKTPATMPTSILNVCDQVLGAWLLGTVSVAWLLGHAYLTATRMTIAPLRRISRLFSLAVLLRCAYLALCLLLMYTAPGWLASGTNPTALGSSWLILSLRVGAGLVALGLFAYMVGDCVKLRSTQSATGILYFASLFAYVGELSSQHLLSQLGLPL